MFKKFFISYCKAKVSIVQIKAIILLCFFCCNLLITLSAQQNRFMYLQSENKQTFYAKFDKKIFSSSASGYLIIPKLAEGNYNFKIGFPKNEFPEQSFNYTITKDVGFIIKNFEEKGYGLFNLQSMAVVTASVEQQSVKQPIAEELADANIKAKIISNREDTVQQLPNTPKPQIAEVVTASSIKKLSQSQNSEGINIVFADVSNQSIDTIQLFIPLDVPPQGNEKPINKEMENANLPAQKDSTVANSKFVNIELPNLNTIADSSKTDSVIIAKTDYSIVPRQINPRCKDLANEQDFLKLRKKMAAENNDDDMISAAKKSFKNKCYTIGQIKNLSALFLKDEGKYNFYDAAYPYVFDLHNFNTLQNQLSNQYFINRFKAMIHN
jgi:hypothetical protein